MSDLLLHNATLLTMAGSAPAPGAVGVRDGRIVAVGAESEAERALSGRPERVDCKGGLLMPAFIDGHIHLLSYAASLRHVDCSGARSIAEIQDAIRRKATETPEGAWVRASGYEETRLAEGRHPTAAELDAATSVHPVRLAHSSGHARVLNSLGLRLAGIDSTTEEPPGGVIERDKSTGEPTGLLIGMEEIVDRAVPNLMYEELASAVNMASDNLLRAGITCIVDATHTNGPEEWRLFERLISDGALRQDVVMMEGHARLGELPEKSADGRLRRGAAKVMLHELEHSSPDPAELSEMKRLVGEAHATGRQVAIHAVGKQAVLAAIDAIEGALRERPREHHRHRIEHCGMLPAGAARRIAGLGIRVVSQPAFVRERGDRYRALLSEEKLARMYAFRSLLDAGVVLGAGSDAPVTSPEPLVAVDAAATRKTASGASVGPEQAVERIEALRWWTAGSAEATFQEPERGSIEAGKLADLLLFEPDVAVAGGWQQAPVLKTVWKQGSRVWPDTN